LKNVWELRLLSPGSDDIYKDGPSAQDKLEEAYKGRPLSNLGLAASRGRDLIDFSKVTEYDLVHLDNVHWDIMNFQTFITWFKLTNQPEGNLRRIHCAIDDGTELYVTKRKRKSVVRLDPWKPLDFDDEASCFSILYQYFPFRDLSELHGKFKEDGVTKNFTYVQFLKECYESDAIPEEIRATLKYQMVLDSVRKDKKDDKDYDSEKKNKKRKRDEYERNENGEGEKETYYDFIPSDAEADELNECEEEEMNFEAFNETDKDSFEQLKKEGSVHYFDPSTQECKHYKDIYDNFRSTRVQELIDEKLAKIGITKVKSFGIYNIYIAYF
jgi:hypothetical protein